MLIEHLENLYAFYGPHTGVRVGRKHIGWYSRGCREAAAFRDCINQVESTGEQLRLTQLFFDRMSAAQELAA